MSNSNNNDKRPWIPFYQKRWIFFAISLSIMLVGVIMILIYGVQLDIQFKGGALLKYSYTGDINPEEAADVASALLGRPVTAQTTSDLSTNEKRLVINIAGEEGVEAGEQEQLDAALKAQFSGRELALSESSMVEPFFGRKFLRNSILALLLAAALVVIYVWIRFRRIGGLSAGAMALVALFHDILIVFFVSVLFRIPIGDEFVTVALTIIGYSINDTIVIYDRIRENNKIHGTRLPVEDIMDLSVTQSLTRSINTNLAVFISVGMVYILAFAHSIDSIQDFALLMTFGAISGCYSTVCITGPLWVMWKKRKKKKK